MRCDEALAAISAAVDGELVDDDGTVRTALDEHLASCDTCREFQSYTVELRARLRFEAVDTVPDVASGVMVAVREQVAEDAARAEAEGEGGKHAGRGATITTLPFWRRARSALRPPGRAGRTGGTGRTGPAGAAGTAPPSPGAPRGRPLAAAVAAALVTGMIVGAAFVGVGQDMTPAAWAEDLPQQVVEAQRDIVSLEAGIVVTERGRPDRQGERRFTGQLVYESPERLALELTEDVATSGDPGDRNDDRSGDEDDDGDSGSGSDAASDDDSAGIWARLQPGEGDVHLLVRDDRWWLETVRRCTAIVGQTSCPPGGSRWTVAVTGREAFSDAAPIPLELIGAVDSFTLAAAPPVLGERRIAGRDAVGVRVSAAQVAHFLAALSPGGDLRSVHPSDPVDVWLDRDDLVPLAVDVNAGSSDERAAWATANDFREQPGDTVLSFSVVSIAVNEAVPDAVFEWTGDDADATADEGAEVPSDEADQAVDETSDGTGTADDGALPTEGSGAADSAGGAGEPGQGTGGTDPVGGAALPTSTTTTTARGVPAGSAEQPLDLGDGSGDATAAPTTTTTAATSTTLPEDPGEPPAPTSTTTTTSTTVPPTTTTTGLVDGTAATVEPPVDDDPGADTDDPLSGEDAGQADVDQAPIDDRTTRDEGFRAGEATLAPEPSRLPDGMDPHVSGTIPGRGRAGSAGQIIAVRSWTDGRAWAKVRATDGWDGPRLFGELGDAVRQVDLGAGGQGYVSADGRKVALHTDRLDVVVSGSLPTEQLLEIAGSLGLVGAPVPGDWPESASATLDEARQAQPALLVPRDLEGFGPPAVDIGDSSVAQLYAGPGDRAFTLTRSDTPVLAPPAGDDSFGVEVRGSDGRYSVRRGELEWTEDGAAHSLLSRTISLSELLAIAETLAPLPEAP